MTNPCLAPYVSQEWRQHSKILLKGLTQWTRTIAGEEQGRTAKKALAGKAQQSRANCQPRPERGLHFCCIFRTEFTQDLSFGSVKGHQVSYRWQRVHAEDAFRMGARGAPVATDRFDPQGISSTQHSRQKFVSAIPAYFGDYSRLGKATILKLMNILLQHKVLCFLW